MIRRKLFSAIAVFSFQLLVATLGMTAFADTNVPVNNDWQDAAPLSFADEQILTQFRAPLLSYENKVEILKQANRLDPRQLIPKNLLVKALGFYHGNFNLLGNRNYLAVVNLHARSTEPRMYILNMNTGAVWRLHVAHGAGSDKNNDGYATQFSNAYDSNMSSVGFFRTGEIYEGIHGRSLRLDGLSPTNSNVRGRAVVIHGADYVKEADVIQGRSWGCFAVAMGQRDRVVDTLKNGAIIYAGLAN